MIDKAIVNNALTAESINNDRLKKVLLDARKKIIKDLEGIEDPNQFEVATLKSIENHLDSINYLDTFEWDKTYNQGLNDGKDIVGNVAGIPNNSSYWGWNPTIPVNALQVEKTRYVDDIRKVSETFKSKVSRTIRANIALGYPLQRSMDDLMGSGLRGLKGKDGIFRSAVYRAEMISRSVTNDLLNQGSLETYNQVSGVSPSLKIKKVWTTVSDNRTSKVCLSLNGQIRALEDDFVSPYNGWTGKSPSAHPFCRSRVTAVTAKYSDKVENEFREANKNNPLVSLVNKNTLSDYARLGRRDPMGLPASTVVSLDTNFTAETFDQALLKVTDYGTYRSINSFIKGNDIQMMTYSGDHTFIKNLDYLYRNSDKLTINGVRPTKENLAKFLYLDSEAKTYDGANFIVNKRAGQGAFKPDVKALKSLVSDMADKKVNPLRHYAISDIDDDTDTLANSLHELGHLVANKRDHQIKPTNSDYISEYSKFDDQEWFAESFVAYVVNPGALKRADKTTYDYIKTAIMGL